MKIVAHLAWIIPVVAGAVLLALFPLAASDPEIAVAIAVTSLVVVAIAMIAALIALIGSARRRQVIVPAVVGLVLSSALGIAALTAERERARLSRPRAVASSDGRWQLSAPATWESPAEPKPGASLHLVTASGDLLLIESQQYDSDLSEISLTGLADDIFEEVAAQEVCRRLTEPRPFTVSGLSAVRLEYLLTREGTDMVVIHIVLFENDTLHQIVLSTTDEQLQLRRAVIDEILSSVTITPAG
jgi:hypothetical protein